MKVSVILLDWSVRESFHSVEYLNEQSTDRKDYETIWVEYFERRAPALEEHCRAGRLDRYLVLGNKPGTYNKHEAWNAGVLASSGEIAVLCDSDAIFGNGFIQSIIDFFDTHGNSFLYIDEIRSENRSFWPFPHPSREEVMAAPGLINWDYEHRTTVGLLPEFSELPLYRRMLVRNYGACLCVKKSDYIRFGGLDEHHSYTGYICGPYDLAVRMINGGVGENWHGSEFILHTYHPGEKRGTDRMGPHFRNNSTTSLKYIFDGNILPHVENRDIRALRRKLYPQPARKGGPKFSVIVPGARPGMILQLYDSVESSTKLPYEAIFIGDENYCPDEEGLKYLKSGGPAQASVLAGCREAAGEIIIIAPPEAVFRRDALDALLDSGQRLKKPVVFLKAIETFSDGFLWRYCNGFALEGEKFFMVAFQRELLQEGLTEEGLRELCREDGCRGVQDSFGKSSCAAPATAEIWREATGPEDEMLQQMLDKMLELKRELFNTAAAWDRLREAELLLERLLAVESECPGRFLKYCFSKRYSLREYCYFVSAFQRLNRTDMAAAGYRLLADRACLLLKNINEGITEAAWLHDLLATEAKGFIGTARFSLGMYELNRNDRIKASEHFKACLGYMPEFAIARRILETIS